MAEPVKMIDVQPFKGRVTVTAGGTVIADTADAVLLSEYGYDPVYYIPRRDIRMQLLKPSDKETLCPHKGIAGYWTFATGDTVIDNIAWCYETPVSSVAPIAGHLAFYRDRLERFDVTTG